MNTNILPSIALSLLIQTFPIQTCQELPNPQALEECISTNPHQAIALINAGAHITKKDILGRSYLHKTHEPTVLHKLLTSGLNPNEPDNNGLLPIECATNPCAIKIFLAHGAHPNSLSITNFTVLRDPELVSLALIHQKNRDIINNPDTHGDTPLSKAINLLIPVESISLLLQAKADVHAPTPDGSTLLHKAFADDKYQMMKGARTTVSRLLIGYGAQPLKDKTGCTPLMAMTSHKHNKKHRLALIDQFYSFEAHYYGVNPIVYKQCLLALANKKKYIEKPTPEEIQTFWEQVTHGPRSAL